MPWLTPGLAFRSRVAQAAVRLCVVPAGCAWALVTVLPDRAVLAAAGAVVADAVAAGAVVMGAVAAGAVVADGPEAVTAAVPTEEDEPALQPVASAMTHVSAVAGNTRRSMSGDDIETALLLRKAAHWPCDTHDAAGAAPVVPDAYQQLH
ncbi:hypothetical protein [Streptomyces incarnatus]|uniref:hypothetical protein n=1 Tax=Streptomyces incarnatus TaxID=665007 RepID=UPI001FC9A69E|nr:hypothetical protein [Streptomyces incarnatus]